MGRPHNQQIGAAALRQFVQATAHRWRSGPCEPSVNPSLDTRRLEQLTRTLLLGGLERRAGAAATAVLAGADPLVETATGLGADAVSL